tara:strand:+ start:763 stop:1098 length:336 start_codon:yes stop_codon:yes gene_type:complete
MTPLFVKAQDQIPEGLYDKQVQFNLGCTKGFFTMVDYLSENYKEEPIVMSHLDQDTTFVLFVNENKTTSTLVITKKLKYEEESCIIWAGQSNGTSLSINPNPIYKPKGSNT